MDEQALPRPFDDPSDTVRHEMRVLDDQKARLDRLRVAILSGDPNAPAEDFDLAAFLANQHAGPAEPG